MNFRERFGLGRFQRDIEAALATMLYSDEEQEERRRIRPRRSRRALPNIPES